MLQTNKLRFSNQLRGSSKIKYSVLNSWITLQHIVERFVYSFGVETKTGVHLIMSRSKTFYSRCKALPWSTLGPHCSYRLVPSQRGLIVSQTANIWQHWSQYRQYKIICLFVTGGNKTYATCLSHENPRLTTFRTHDKVGPSIDGHYFQCYSKNVRMKIYEQDSTSEPQRLDHLKWSTST